MMADSNILDLIIVGAGPAGIATAVESKRVGIEKILLIEKGPRHSYSIEKLYTPGKRVDKAYLGQEIDCEGSVCIVDGTRETVLKTLDQFIDDYGLEIITNTEVDHIEQVAEDLFVISDLKKRQWMTRTVVIAIGVYGRPNKPDYSLPSSLKQHIWFDLSSDIPINCNVLIVGGGNTALEYAQYLYPDHRVTLSYRGDEFTKANEVNRRIISDLEKNKQVEILLLSDVDHILDLQEQPRIEVTFKDRTQRRFDHILYALGGTTPESFLKKVGVIVEGKNPATSHAFESGVPGLYLAGDLVSGGKGTIVKAFNTGRTVVWDGLCQRQLECRIPISK
jgi:thioredoxin reductase (NADPH)